MIRKIRSSLTIKICLLISILLIAASGITYAVIARFLPTYYSSRLEQELDEVSQEMAETIGGYEKIEDAFLAIELFETGSQVSVVILDEQGNMVWPKTTETEVAADYELYWEEGDALAWNGVEVSLGLENAEGEDRVLPEIFTVLVSDDEREKADGSAGAGETEAEAAVETVTETGETKYVAAAEDVTGVNETECVTASEAGEKENEAENATAPEDSAKMNETDRGFVTEGDAETDGTDYGIMADGSAGVGETEVVTAAEDGAGAGETEAAAAAEGGAGAGETEAAAAAEGGAGAGETEAAAAAETVTETDGAEISAGEIAGVERVVEYRIEEDATTGFVTFLMYDTLSEQSEEISSAVKHYDISLGNAKYTMIVSGGMQPVNQAMEILYQIFPYILAVSVAVAAILAAGASLYLTAPMVKLSRTSQNMAALNFDDRYQGRRTDEIGKLGQNLNQLSANLSAALGELHEANDKLKADIEKEREAERRQIEFFSAVSHELKTPITILQGHLSGMLQGVGEYRNRERYLSRSLATAEKMEGMVEELLTVSRIENNAFTTCRTDVAEQLRQQIADMTELIEEKNLVLAVDIEDHVYAEVNPGMIEKVFRNLLINAVRYTPAGAENEIRVVMYENDVLWCSIENTGVFIEEDDLPHLFEAFYRAEHSRNSQTGGSGLGLYIVKMVLEQHGAKYGLENTAEGVRVWFSMPPDPVGSP